MARKRKASRPANGREEIEINGRRLVLGAESAATVRQDTRHAVWIRKVSETDDAELQALYFGYAKCVAAVLEGEPPTFDEYCRLNRADSARLFDAAQRLGWFGSAQLNPTPAVETPPEN